MTDTSENYFKRWLVGIGTILFIQTLTLLVVGVHDHYLLMELQRIVERDTDRVERLWWSHELGDQDIGHRHFTGELKN